MKTRGNGSGSGEDRMRTLIRDLLRYSTTSAILEGQPTLDRTRVPRSCRLKTKLISLLSAAVFMCLGADCALAVNAESGIASATSARPNAQAKPATLAQEEVEHGPTQKPVEIARPFGFPITNSMVVSWIVAVGLVLFAQVATRHMKPVPEGAQNFWEWLVEGLYTFLEGIIGSHLVKRTFWFFATIFIFILFTNWFGLIPGVGTIGWGEQGAHGFEVTRPLLRGGNADLNMTFAMAGVFMVLWLVWALQSNGIWGLTLHLFGPKGASPGFIQYMMIVVFFLV